MSEPRTRLVAATTPPDFAFQPATMTAPRRATVMWRNDASITHPVTSNTGAFSSGNLSPGMTFTHQFSQAGTYQYHCSIHPSMTGTIVVQ
ncbi:MAG: plastocyanin/azurin family copper-binding protein [Halobacteriota archaeon]